MNDRTFPGVTALINAQCIHPFTADLLNILWKWSPNMLIVGLPQSCAPHVIGMSCSTESVSFSECPWPGQILSRSENGGILWLQKIYELPLLERYLREMTDDDESLSSFLKKFPFMMIFNSEGKFQSLNYFGRPLNPLSVEWYSIQCCYSPTDKLSFNYGQLPFDLLSSLTEDQIETFKSHSNRSSVASDIVDLMLTSPQVNVKVNDLIQWTETQSIMGYGFFQAVSSFVPAVDPWLLILIKTMDVLPYETLKKILTRLPEGNHQLVAWLKLKWNMSRIGASLVKTQEVNSDFAQYLATLISKYGAENEMSESVRELAACYYEYSGHDKKKSEKWIIDLKLRCEI